MDKEEWFKEASIVASSINNIIDDRATKEEKEQSQEACKKLFNLKPYYGGDVHCVMVWLSAGILGRERPAIREWSSLPSFELERKETKNLAFVYTGNFEAYHHERRNNSDLMPPWIARMMFDYWTFYNSITKNKLPFEVHESRYARLTSLFKKIQKEGIRIGTGPTVRKWVGVSITYLMKVVWDNYNKYGI